jgi:hypothetical protein
MVNIAQGRIVLRQLPVDFRQPLENRAVGRQHLALLTNARTT